MYEKMNKLLRNPKVWIGYIVLLPGSIVIDISLIISAIICYSTILNKDDDKLSELYEGALFIDNEIINMQLIIMRVIITLLTYIWIFT